MKYIKPSIVIAFVNITVVALLFLLPYYLFGGRLFLGGDDTRLYYAYPEKVLISLNLFSWNNISSLPSYIPNHHAIPFFLVAWFLELLISSKVHLFYFLFSLLQVISFIYFQKFIRELVGKEYSVSIIASLLYILSPITLVSMSFFLTPVWVTALFPVVAYYYLSFIHRGKVTDIIKVVLWSLFFSIAYFALPWVAGLLLPLFFGLVFFSIFVKRPQKSWLRKTFVFGLFIVFSQVFWIVPFLASISYHSSGLGERVSSKDLLDSFAPTVLATATDNIIYPLLTFYHRQIAIDFNLQLRNAFTAYYDYVLPLSIIFIIVLFLGILKYKQALKDDKIQKAFIFFFASFIVALYLFTVNIGFLKDIFLLFGYIPGFAVFRNFTDKFALGYIFVYSSFLALCLYVVKKSISQYKLLFTITVMVVLINFIPVKTVISSPLWTTKSIYTTVTLPQEYLSFAEKVKLSVPNTSNIIQFPQNIAAYSVIVEGNGKNAYIGVSPLKFFTGVNDLTGGFSYPPPISKKIKDLIVKKDYKGLLDILEQINTGYLIATYNIPDEINKSYLFDSAYLPFQNKNLIHAIVDRELVRSNNGSYVLFKLKNSPHLFKSSAEISYKKINPVKYEIKISNLKGKKDLLFFETYHPGWKLYTTKGTESNSLFSNVTDVFKFIQMPIYDNSHNELVPYGNKWTIDSSEVKNKTSQVFYESNKDGTINMKMTLYFLPQVYFYLGMVITVLCLSIGGLFLFIKKNDFN